MTKAERDAMDDGYYFSGIYEYFKSEATEKATEKRKQGYMAKTVFVPSSKYSRGHRAGGYSVYIKPTKKKIKEIEKRKAQEEKTKQDNLKTIENYLDIKTGAELMEHLKKILKSDFSGHGEVGLLSWATQEKII